MGAVTPAGRARRSSAGNRATRFVDSSTDLVPLVDGGHQRIGVPSVRLAVQSGQFGDLRIVVACQQQADRDHRLEAAAQFG